MTNVLLSIVLVTLAENLVFSQMLGIFAAFDVTVNLRKTLTYWGYFAISSVLATVICAPLRQPLLGTWWLLPILAVFASLLFSVLILFASDRFAKSVTTELKPLVSLVTLNGAATVLAVLYTTNTIASAMITAVGAAIGALLALLVFLSVRARMRQCEPPSVFRGLPIYLAAAGLVALAFAGFSGMQF